MKDFRQQKVRLLIWTYPSYLSLMIQVTLEGQFHDVMNQFPHTYTTTHKKSIPLSLVHVFVSISRRLGIPASPVNFPGTVLARVPSLSVEENPVIVNLFATDVERSIVESHNASSLSPCGSFPMLLRASRNILSSFRTSPDTTGYTAQASMSAATTIQLLSGLDEQLITPMFFNIDALPTDYATLFLDKLAPNVTNRCRMLLENHCNHLLDLETTAAEVTHCRSIYKTTRPIKYFVGMVFKHIQNEYIGCITGWDVRIYFMILD